jgi:hypothetical protein
MRGVRSGLLPRVFAPAIVLSLLISSCGRRANARVRAIGLLLIVFASTARAQQDLGAQAILSYRFFGIDGSSQNGFDQIYDVQYQRAVTDPLRVQLFFRGEGNKTNQNFGLFETGTSFWRLQPFAEVDYLLPQIQFLGRYEAVGLTSSFSQGSERGRQQFVQRAMETLNWTPDRLPSLVLHGEQFSNRDAAAGIDQTQSLLSQAINYTWRALSVGEFADYRKDDLGTSNFTRTAADVQGFGRLEGTFLGGRGSISGEAVAGLTHLEESTTSGASAPTQLTIVAASFVHDETPLDARDVSPTATPALIDRDFKTGAGISLGLDAPSFQNIILDMGRFVGVDTVRVFVRDSAGNLVPFGGLVRWDAYTSSNGFDWTSLGTVTTAFIVSLSAYEVAFTKTSLRFVKVVSFGANSVDTRVTEVQAFFHTQFAANETRTTDVRFVTANLNLAGQVTPWLALTYNGIFNDYKTVQPNRPDYASIDNDQILSADIRPSRALDLTVRYEERTVTPTGGTEDRLRTYWGILQFTPNRYLATTVEATRTKEANLLDITTDTLRVTQYARFLDSFYLNFDGGVAKQESATQDLQTKTMFVDGTAYAQLTRAINLLLAANLQRDQYSGSAAAALGLTERTSDRYYAELTYQPSAKLILSGRIGYSSAAGLSGTIKAWRVQWYPFAGGTIGLGTIYDEDVDTNHFSQRFRRLQILPTWIVNRHATLTINYNFLSLQNSGADGVAATETKARQFFVSLTLVL